MDAASRPIGLVSCGDALRWQQDGAPKATSIGDQLSDRSLPLVVPSTPGDSVANRMITEDVGRICVVDPGSGVLVGIIGRRDLLKSRARRLKGEQARSRPGFTSK